MIVSLTIVRYRKFLLPFALLAMGVHRLPLMLNRRCSFWKLLGSGENGTFDLKPDWQQWGLLAVWDDRQAFDSFYKTSLISTWWNIFDTERWTILCEPLQAHGKWDGKSPFGKPDIKTINGPVAVLTRATIRLNKLKCFWANVKGVADIMTDAPGFIASLGVGEAPFYRQATFSIWQSIDDVKAFAYTSKEHAEVIKKTRNENWYSEELFARFKIIDSLGTIKGKNPLSGIAL